MCVPTSSGLTQSIATFGLKSLAGQPRLATENTSLALNDTLCTQARQASRRGIVTRGKGGAQAKTVLINHKVSSFISVDNK